MLIQKGSNSEKLVFMPEPSSHSLTDLLFYFGSGGGSASDHLPLFS